MFWRFTLQAFKFNSITHFIQMHSNFNAIQHWINQIDTFASHAHTSRSDAELAQLRWCDAPHQNIANCVVWRQCATWTEYANAYPTCDYWCQEHVEHAMSHGLSVRDHDDDSLLSLQTQNHFSFEFMNCSPHCHYPQAKLRRVFPNLMFTTFFSYRIAIHSF